MPGMTTQDDALQVILDRDEAGVSALIDTYLPAEEIYLAAAAHASGDPSIVPITTASATPLNR